MRFLIAFFASITLLFDYSSAITYDQLMFSSESFESEESEDYKDIEFVRDYIDSENFDEKSLGQEELEELLSTVLRLQKERDRAYVLLDDMLLRLEDATSKEE